MNNIFAYYHYSNYKDMLRHLTRQMQAAYTNIRLTTHPDRHAAFLTLANSKKRNPLSLATIREINTALG